MLLVPRMSVQGPLFQDSSSKMRQFKGTLTLETNFMHIYVLKYIFLSSNILSITLYVIARKMIYLNKSNVLTTIESINRNLKKCWENNFKYMGTICTQFRNSEKYFCSVIQGLTSQTPLTTKTDNTTLTKCMKHKLWHSIRQTLEKKSIYSRQCLI